MAPSQSPNSNWLSTALKSLTTLKKKQNYNSETTTNNLFTKPTQQPPTAPPFTQPPRPLVVRISKFACQGLILGNLALAVYILVEAKRKDKPDKLQNNHHPPAAVVHDRGVDEVIGLGADYNLNGSNFQS